MKLPAFFALTLCALAQDAPKTILPLPDFHESWTEQEQATLTQFATHLDQFRQEQQFEKDEWGKIAQYLHSVVTGGSCKAQFDDDGDTLARIAAMVDESDAVRLFLKRGENVNAVHHSDSADMPVTLASEVIWAEGLISTKQTAAERVALLQELQAAGWDAALHAPSVIFALPIVCLCEAQDVSPLVEWFLTLNYNMDEEQKNRFYSALLVANGCTHLVKKFVEDGFIKLNEPLYHLLPLQHVCEKPMFDKVIPLDTLEYLLQAGADPNLILADEETEDDGTYDPDGYEADDQPRDDMAGFSTPIEMLFDYYRFDIAWDESSARKKALSVLAAMDLLLLHGAELEIEHDEYDDEAAESEAYAETRKRLQMTDAELEADYKKLRDLLNENR